MAILSHAGGGLYAPQTGLGVWIFELDGTTIREGDDLLACGGPGYYGLAIRGGQSGAEE